MERIVKLKNVLRILERAEFSNIKMTDMIKFDKILQEYSREVNEIEKEMLDKEQKKVEKVKKNVKSK